MWITFVVMALHAVFAIYVWKDCKKLIEQGRKIIILPPVLWAFSTVMFSFLGVGLYWLVHYSLLARKEP